MTDIALPAEACFILDGLAEGVSHAERALQVARSRFESYVIQQAKALGCNDSTYTFDPDKRVFARTKPIE